MFDTFQALDSEKKKKIMNAAMTEFVRGGYEKASMNRLVEQAGISKGSLFYYFENKKNLYLFLFEHFEDLIINNAKQHTDQPESDFILRMEYVMHCNVKLLMEYPLVFAFVNACKAEKSPSVYDEIQQIKNRHCEELFSNIYKDIDITLFREEINVEFAKYTIKTTLFQLMHDALRKSVQDEAVIMKTVRDYVNFFKKAFYK